MNFKDFEKLYLKMVDEEINVGKTKGREYTQGDRLDNFRRIGEELNLDPEKVLWVYLKKHLDSIANYIREGKVYSESIESRIMDARVYLGLLRGIIEEKKKNLS